MAALFHPNKSGIWHFIHKSARRVTRRNMESVYNGTAFRVLGHPQFCRMSNRTKREEHSFMGRPGFFGQSDSYGIYVSSENSTWYHFYPPFPT